MQAAVTVTPSRIPELLLGLATVRPVFVWDAPGLGKSSLVRSFAESLGLVRVPHASKAVGEREPARITDGWCDTLRVRREHACLIPQDDRLPFTAQGPVFRVR